MDSGYLIRNYIILIVGMILIGLFWNHLTKKESQKERKAVKRYSVTFFILGIVMFTIQYFTSL